MMASSVSMALIEPNAYLEGGHFHHTLIELSRAATAEGRKALVVALDGVTSDTRTALQDTAGVLDHPSQTDVRGRIAWAGAVGLRHLSRLGVLAVSGRRLPLPIRRLPHQLTLLSRCLVEVASLRAAVRHAPIPPVPVILTASEALHAMAGWLSGVDYLRIVHEVYTTEDAPVRLLGRLARLSRRRVLAIGTTPAVEADLISRFPGLSTTAHPFTVLQVEDRPDDREREAARASFGIAADETVAAVVGGWWGHKDPGTIRDALAATSMRLHLIVAGSPLDATILNSLACLPNVHLHVVHRVLTAAEVRTVYAASDVTIVSRRPGIAKESGLVMDAARFGIPLIVSDHDIDLTARLAGCAWAQIFRASESDDLARTLPDIGRMLRPPHAAAGLLGMRTAPAQLADLRRLYEHRLTERGARP